jgi:hypothetical protein
MLSIIAKKWFPEHARAMPSRPFAERLVYCIISLQVVAGNIKRFIPSDRK